MIEVKQDWYRHFFSSEMPGRVGKYDESKLSQHQVDFIVNCLGVTRDSKLLDLCCGKGRHLVELLRRGFDVVGVDSSSYMLSECRTLAESEGFAPTLKLCDIREIEFESEFDAVYMVLPALGFFDSDQDDHRIVLTLAKALKSFGLLFMDLVPLEWSIRHYTPERSTVNQRGDKVVKRKHYDPIKGKISGSEVTYLPDGTTDEREHCVRLYSYSEMSTILHQIGFRIQSTFGDYAGSRYTIHSPNMIIIAQKVD